MSTATQPIAQVRTFPAPAPLLSTVAAKFLVAITGLGLVGFVLAHMAGNLLVFAGPEALNHYAKKLKDLGPLLWIARAGLLAIFVLHVVLALWLNRRNAKARPRAYRKKRYVEATLASRYMVLTGLVVLAFVIFHLAHYTFGLTQQAEVISSDGRTTRAVSMLDLRDKEGHHDVYGMVITGFREWPVALTYMFANVLLAFHLYHGVASVFQTLGLNHPRYNGMVKALGAGIAVLVAVGNVSMPLAVALRFVGAEYIPTV